ncbi:hypothetical protein ACE5LO_21095, partial [Paenibacillus medicaginis]
TTVKPSSADGTWTEGSWESRTLPGKQLNKPVIESSIAGLFASDFLYGSITKPIIEIYDGLCLSLISF